MSAASFQLWPSNTSVGPISFPLACPPATTILSPTTAAAPAARGRLSLGSSTHAPFRNANTRSDGCAVRLAPVGTQPPMMTGSPL
jgi:hypothetical protein